MKIIIYCSLIYVMAVYATCNKRVDCKQNIYSFEAAFKAYSDKDSVRVNDTIWLELITSSKLNDLMTNQVVDYSGSENLGTTIGYAEFNDGDILNPGVTPAANSFENILVSGKLGISLKPDQVREFLFNEQNGQYVFKLGVVPKKTGSFLVSPGNSAGVYRKNNTCDKASFDLTFKNTNQHLYLYEQKRPGYVLSDYDRGHLYAFKVY